VVADRNIYIWCTETFARGRTTGVERVVRFLFSNASEIGLQQGFGVKPVVLHDDSIVVLDKQAFTSPAARKPLVPPSGAVEGGARRLLDVKKLTPILRWYRVRLLEVMSQQLFRLSGSKSLQRLPFLELGDYPGAQALRQFWRKLRGKGELKFPLLYRLDDQKNFANDILIIPEMRWNRRGWQAVRDFQASGGKVVTIIHDLIPILHNDPSYNAANRAGFAAWIELQVSRSDAILAVSNTVAEELRCYFARHIPARAAAIPIGYFHNGSDFDAVQQIATELSPDIAAIFDPGQHVFLMVGSLTPRKNHRFVLDAFDRYWARGGQATLVLVGYDAYGSDDLLTYLQSHPGNGTFLHHLTDINDAELETVYRSSAALIMASSSEGFGLPLVEAMQRGVPVLCSDIPIFHEVTADHAEFFSLDTPDALTALIVDFETRHPPGRPVPRKPKRCLSWRDSTEMMLMGMFELLKVP
jgi:glycosyltransferase involved in cell wall biosynthesis